MRGIKSNRGKKANNSGRSYSNNSSSGIMSSLSGGTFVPSDDPPVISGSPWNNAILETMVDNSTKNHPFTIAELKTIMTNQLGFSTCKVDFEFRLLALSAWAFPASDSNNSGAVFGSLRFAMFPMNCGVGQNNVELARIDSHSMKNKFAKVGYRYPIAQSVLPLTTLSNTNTLVSLYTSTAANVFLHIKILWRGAAQGFQVYEEDRTLVNYYFPIKRQKQSESDFEKVEGDDFVEEILSAEVKDVKIIK